MTWSFSLIQCLPKVGPQDKESTESRTNDSLLKIYQKISAEILRKIQYITALTKLTWETAYIEKKHINEN